MRSSGLKTFSQIGVIMILFSSGLETDLKELKRSGLASSLIALAGVLVPIGLGVAGVTLEFVEKALEAGDIRLLETDFSIPARSVDMCTLRDVTPTAAAAAFMEMVRQGTR